MTIAALMLSSWLGGLGVLSEANVHPLGGGRWSVVRLYDDPYHVLRR